MSTKIAFIIEKFMNTSIGGEPIIHHDVIQNLLKRGYLIDVYCENAELLNDSFPENLKYYCGFSENEEQRKLVNKNNYDIIISSRFGLKFSEIKADLYTIHSHSDLYSQKSKFGKLYSILKPKQKRIKNEIENLKQNEKAKFIFCSKQLLKDYISLADLKRTVVINPYPNCIPKEDTIKVKNDIFTFGISALGFQNKGGYLILKSAFLLKLLGKKFKIRIIYKEKPGLLQKMLVNILGLKNYVEFLPKQNGMHSFYNSIDCLVMPSQLESFGMVAEEGMAFSIPVIVSSTSGSTELINDGINGFVFDFKSHRLINLFKKMKYVLVHKNNLHILSKNAVTTVSDLNKDSYFTKFMDVLNN